MAQYINTNVASLNAQRNLGRSQGAMNTAMQRLSTGLRINSAKDDAAGLAISERFTAQIRGLDQAMRNANDGISLAQTAEGALAELTNNLQRIRELAVQSANVTNSASDRAALDAEVQQRIDEIDRIATQTTFNGLRVLDGSAGSATFQVGANVGETIALGLNTNARSGALGQIASATGDVSGGPLTGALTITVGANSPVEIGTSASGSAQDVVAAINSAGVPGLTATATNVVTDDFTTVSGVAGDTYNLEINGVTVYAAGQTDLGTTGDLEGADVAAQINLFSSSTGVTAAFDSTAGEMTFTALDGRNIDITEVLTNTGAGGIDDAIADADGETTTGQISLSASENISLAGTDVAVLGLGAVIAKDSQTLDNVAITDVAGANDAINRIDSALEAVNSFRSDLGAIQNRLESTIVNLQTVNENLAASRGRIQDADFAAETAALTKAQILQQAGVAMLSQANAQPQVALSLLG
ncbi:MAG: flagellin [Pseudomonadota bacterium]